MSRNYIVNNHKPTSITHCVSGSFTGPNNLNLIVAKNNYLEIYFVTSEGLKFFKEFPIYGKIVSLSLFKTWIYSETKGSEFKENLFVLTHKYNVCILECKKDSNDIIQMYTRAYGNMQEKIGRPSETGMIASIDPEGQVIGLRLYDGLYKVIHLAEQKFLHSTMNDEYNYDKSFSKNELKAFNINIEERKIIDITFLEGFETPTLALINQDSEGRHFRTYKLGLYERDLIRGPWNENNIEAEATLLIPVPVLMGGGVIIVGQESIMYYRGDNATSFAIRPPIMKQSSITCFSKIDPNGTRYLLGDMAGRLFMLLLETIDESVVRGQSSDVGNFSHSTAAAPTSMSPYTLVNDMRLEHLGDISIPECLTYLDNAVIFVGSKLGDSQLVRLRTAPIMLDTVPTTNKYDQFNYQQHSPAGTMHPKETSRQYNYTYIETMDTITNLGPIIDMIVVDPEKSGHKDQLITCSGAFKEGSLRILRDGIGLSQLASLELPTGVRGLWTLKNSVTQADSYLVIALSDLSTRVIAFEATATTNESNISDHSDGNALGLSLEETLEEIDMPGLITDGTTTLWCGDVCNNNVLQVTTTRGCRLLDRINSRILREWSVPIDDDASSGTVTANITLVSCNANQLLLASGANLYYLEITKNDLQLRCHRNFPYEIACLNINALPRLNHLGGNSPASSTYPSSNNLPPIGSLFCAVGFWTNICIQILGPLPTSLETLWEEVLPKNDIIPRSIMMCYFKDEQQDFQLSAPTNLVESSTKIKPGKTADLTQRKGDLDIEMKDGVGRNVKESIESKNDKETKIEDEFTDNPLMESIVKGCFLLVALGDGTIYYFNIHPRDGRLSDRKKFNAGTRPPLLKLIGINQQVAGIHTSSSHSLLNLRQATLNGFVCSSSNSNRQSLSAISTAYAYRQNNVLICSDRPAIVYRRNGKLVVSDVNVDEVGFAVPFDSASYPDCLIFVPSPASGLIVIGKIDEIRKLHIRTVPLFESPRRIAYQETTETFGLISVRVDVHNGTTFVPPTPTAVNCIGGTGGRPCISVRAPKHSSLSSTFISGAINLNSFANTLPPPCNAILGSKSSAVNFNTLSSSASTNTHQPSSQHQFLTYNTFPNNSYDSNATFSRGGSGMPASASYGDEMEAHSLIILDSHTYEPLWAHHFQPFEYAISLISCQLVEPSSSPDNDNSQTVMKEYYAVGTAMVYPEDAEPKAGKIFIFEFGNSKCNQATHNVPKENEEDEKVLTDISTTYNRCLTLVSEKEISGAPYSMCQFPSAETFATLKASISNMEYDHTQDQTLINLTADGDIEANLPGDTASQKTSNNVVASGGNVTSHQQLAPKLLVSVNSTVRLFEWFPSDKELRLECSHFNNILALYLKTRGDFVLVGDLMRSLALLNYKPLEGNFEEVARDYNPSWTSAIEIVDNACETFIAADNSFNLFVCGTKENLDQTAHGDDIFERGDNSEGIESAQTSKHAGKEATGRKRRPSLNSPSAGPSTRSGLNSITPNTAPISSGNLPSATLLDDERRYLYPTGLYHLADFTNVIRHGILVSKNITLDSSIAIENSLLLGTISGSVHLILQIPQRLFAILDRLQFHMAKQLPSIGKMSHSHFRAFHTEQKNEKSRGFVDGDLVETFLDLGPENKRKLFDLLAAEFPKLFPITSSSSSKTAKQSSKHIKLDESYMTSNSGIANDSLGDESMFITKTQGLTIEQQHTSNVPNNFTLEELVKVIEEIARFH